MLFDEWCDGVWQRIVGMRDAGQLQPIIMPLMLQLQPAESSTVQAFEALETLGLLRNRQALSWELTVAGRQHSGSITRLPVYRDVCQIALQGDAGLVLPAVNRESEQRGATSAWLKPVDDVQVATWVAIPTAPGRVRPMELARLHTAAETLAHHGVVKILDGMGPRGRQMSLRATIFGLARQRSCP